MKNKYDNVVKITCIWRGLTELEQIKEYDKYVEDNNLHKIKVTKWVDCEQGGQHDWFIFHNGELTNEPQVIIDELLEIDDLRTL